MTTTIDHYEATILDLQMKLDNAKTWQAMYNTMMANIEDAFADELATPDAEWLERLSSFLEGATGKTFDVTRQYRVQVTGWVLVVAATADEATEQVECANWSWTGDIENDSFETNGAELA